MKKRLLPLFLAVAVTAYAQDSLLTDEEQVTSVILQFFEALETRDTMLMKDAAMPEGQVWSIHRKDGTDRIAERRVRDDLRQLPSLPPVREIAWGFDITVDRSIACAWVPYEFRVRDQRSHCGIDVFTLFKTDGSWKIMSAAYSIQTEDCDVLKEKYAGP